ncbi:MAG: PQQ-dependent sugar dehydrogenase [Verrucomicrobiota bacterium]
MRSLLRSLPLSLAAALLVSRWLAHAEVQLPAGFAVEVMAGSDAVQEPMELAFAPDGAAWVTGRTGGLWRMDPATRLTRPVGRVETDVSGDRGLHGVAFHPDFPRTPHVFLAYHAPRPPEGRYRALVTRWTVEGPAAEPRLAAGSEKTIVEWEGESAGQHVGGSLLAHPTERVLYVTTGENNQNANLLKYCNDPDNRAQALGDLRGKVLRVGFDGTVPADNPHVGQAGVQPAIYTRGHRQPWALHHDPVIGILVAENGGDLADDHDEVNLLQPGGNYGWPKVFGDGLQTGSRSNRVEGFTSPWFHYRRNASASCTGAVIYRPPTRGNAFPARFHGGLFYADFARKSVRHAPVDPRTRRPGESEPFLQGLAAGPLALRLGPDGALWYITHGGATKASTNDTVARVVFRP